jgi:hypothetical protein
MAEAGDTDPGSLARQIDNTFSAHRREIARRRRPGDDLAEIEHPEVGERHRDTGLIAIGGGAPRPAHRRFRVRFRDAQAEGRPRRDCAPVEIFLDRYAAALYQ